jgi:hypothetical protein
MQAMAVVVVGWLRVKDTTVIDDFFSAATAVIEQAMHSRGNLDADVLDEEDNTYWIRAAWQSERCVTDFMVAEPHRSCMARVESWCDEATFVSWGAGRSRTARLWNPELCYAATRDEVVVARLQPIALIRVCAAGRRRPCRTR